MGSYDNPHPEAKCYRHPQRPATHSIPLGPLALLWHVAKNAIKRPWRIGRNDSPDRRVPVLAAVDAGVREGST